MARSGTAGIPNSPEALAELMASPKKFAALQKDAYRQGDWKRFHAAYARATGLDDPTIEAQVLDQVRDFLTAVFGPQTERPVSSNPPAEADGLFSSYGELFHAIAPKHGKPYADQLAKLRAYSTDIPSEGGFLVPDEHRAELMRLSLDHSIIRPGATVLPMTSERLPVPGTDETTRQDNEFAGVTARFVPEGQPLAAQTPKFLRIVLDVSKILIYFEVPAELVEDALTLQMYLRRVLPMAHAFVEDAAFLDGTGTGEPEGILRSPGRITVSRAGSNEIVWDDIVTMSSRFLPASWPTAIWVANPDSLPQLGHLVQEVKDGSTNVGGSHVPLDRDGQNLGILGRPLRLTEKMPALGSAGDLLLCDPAQYLIGDRQLYTVEASDQHKFRQQMVAYRLKSRVDGRAWVRSAITPKRGSSTLSPYVALGG